MPSVTHDGRSFMIDGRRVWLASGRVPYARLPRDTWADRSMPPNSRPEHDRDGPVFWNRHEPPQQVRLHGRQRSAPLRGPGGKAASTAYSALARSSTRAGTSAASPRGSARRPAALRTSGGPTSRLLTIHYRRRRPIRGCRSLPKAPAAQSFSSSARANGPAARQPWRMSTWESSRAISGGWAFGPHRQLKQSVAGSRRSDRRLGRFRGPPRDQCVSSHRCAQPARIVIDLPLAHPAIWARSPRPGWMHARFSAGWPRCSRVGGQFNLSTFCAGTNFGFFGGRLPDSPTVSLRRLYAHGSIISASGGHTPVYNAVRRIAHLPRDSARLLQTWIPPTSPSPSSRPSPITTTKPRREKQRARPSPRRPRWSTSFGTQGGVAFVFGDPTGQDKRR